MPPEVDADTERSRPVWSARSGTGGSSPQAAMPIAVTRIGTSTEITTRIIRLISCVRLHPCSTSTKRRAQSIQGIQRAQPFFPDNRQFRLRACIIFERIRRMQQSK